MKTPTKDYLRETVCEKCPATCWGQKSICRIHEQHITQVESCPEWDKHIVEQQGLKEDDGQLAFEGMEPAMEWVQKTEELIGEYRHMITRVAWLRQELHRAIEGNALPASSLVAQYGVEATLPKGQGLKLTSLNIPEEVYERKVKRLQELQNKIESVDMAANTITDPQEKSVLEWLLDGEKMTLIATAIGVSRQRLYEIKRNIVIKLAWAMFGKNAA